MEFGKLNLLCVEGFFTYLGDLRVRTLEEHVRHVVQVVVAVCTFGCCCEFVSLFALGSISAHRVGFVPHVCCFANAVVEWDIAFGRVIGLEGMKFVWKPGSAACPVLRVLGCTCGVRAVPREDVLVEVPLVLEFGDVPEHGSAVGVEEFVISSPLPLAGSEEFVDEMCDLSCDHAVVCAAY